MNDERDLMQRQLLREVRATMLRAARLLYGQTPDTVTLHTFQHIVGRHRADETTLLEQAAYLIDLGYLERIEKRRDYLDAAPAVYRLTAKGLQLLNGDIEDRSIAV